MTKLFIFLGFSAFILNACGDSQEDLSKKVALGGAVYGGELRMMSQEKLDNLFPLGVPDIYAVRVTSQVFETILKLDPSGTKVIPGIAESFTASGDAKSFTLKIRKGVYFHADDCFGGEGRELTAEDVKFVLDFSCSGLKMNSISWFLRDKIVGGKEFFANSKTALSAGGVKGITVIDAQTLKIELVNAFGGFDKLLTHPSLGIFPKEAFEKYGEEITKHPVGTGPFVLDEWTTDKIRLKRNDKYWKQDDLGNQLPFLGGITITYSTNKRSELMAFRNKEIDLVSEIPVEEIENVLGTLQEAQEGKNV
jgi:oligopeptide transport system substrate-binding protein